MELSSKPLSCSYNKLFSVATLKAFRVFFIFIVLSCLIFFINGCNIYYKTFYANPESCLAHAVKEKPYHAIIVPGFPADSGQINMVLAERITWAVFLYKNGYTDNIIFSGSAVYTPYPEAEVMKLFALQQGIPSQHIYTETKAEHTTENLYYGCVLAKELGYTKVAFATQPAQASFMKPFKRKFRLHVDMLPIVSDTVLKYSLTFNNIDVSSIYVKNHTSLINRESKIKRLRGTRGHIVKVAIRKARRTKSKKS